MDILLEEQEVQTIYYYCIGTNHFRYDFSVIFSNLFLGKAIVTSLQTGSMVLMCRDDIVHEEIWAEKLGIMELDIPKCKEFFELILNPYYVGAEQY